MRPSTLQWVEKAEGDWRVASREMKVTEGPNWDAVCFHSQQCAEKYLKGFLEEKSVGFRKTHDLVELMLQIAPTLPVVTSLQADLQLLVTHASDTRYPGDTADQAEASVAIEACNRVRAFMRRVLNLIP